MEFLEIVTIDGPVGVGKSAVSRSLAAALNYDSMDTGAMYRAFTLAAMRNNAKTPDEITALVANTNIQLIEENNKLKVFLNDEDVTEEIRDPEVSKNTSYVSDVLAVRNKLASLQRELGKRGKYVCEGRDQGTVVFPDALWKIYLDADIETRVQRRDLQLQKSGKNVEYKKLEDEVKERDYRDRIRPFGALKIAEGSIIFDTSDFNQQEVIEILHTIITKGNNNIK